MSDKTRIEWTDATWNPVTGCTKVGDGCKHCYAEREWARLSAQRAVPNRYTGRKFTDVQMHMDVLTLPLRWKRPRRIFVNSMSDLFHPEVGDRFISDVFGVMAAAHWHTFQVLTKRPAEMRAFFDGMSVRDDIAECMALYTDAPLVWPIPNVYLGVSVEDQATADYRIPLLLQAPAAVHWISAEPLLGPVSFRWAAWHDYSSRAPGFVHGHLDGMRGIDWVVVGGESGPKARPMRPAWVRAIRDQCNAAGVPFLFKQWGEFIEGPGGVMSRCGKKAAGRLLDGVEHNGYPG